MALIKRLRKDSNESAAPKLTAAELLESRARRPDAEYQELKSRVHNRLFEILDLSRMSKVSEERVRQDVAIAAARILFGPEMTIQAPPNLSPAVYPLLVGAAPSRWQASRSQAGRSRPRAEPAGGHTEDWHVSRTRTAWPG